MLQIVQQIDEAVDVSLPRELDGDRRQPLLGGLRLPYYIYALQRHSALVGVALDEELELRGGQRRRGSGEEARPERPAVAPLQGERFADGALVLDESAQAGELLALRGDLRLALHPAIAQREHDEDDQERQRADGRAGRHHLPLARVKASERSGRRERSCHRSRR